MTQVLIAVVAIYFIMVAAAGNGPKLWDLGVREIPGFLPWVGVIFVLGFLAVNPETEKLGKPFFILVLLVWLLNGDTYQQVQKSITDSYDSAKHILGNYSAKT